MENRSKGKEKEDDTDVKEPPLKRQRTEPVTSYKIRVFACNIIDAIQDRELEIPKQFTHGDRHISAIMSFYKSLLVDWPNSCLTGIRKRTEIYKNIKA